MKWVIGLFFIPSIVNAIDPPVLIPFDEYIGSFDTMEIGKEFCTFKFNPYSGRSGITTLAPGTRLSVSPPKEVYGAGTVINKVDGMTCSACAVKSMVMDSTGVTTFHCEGIN